MTLGILFKKNVQDVSMRAAATPNDANDFACARDVCLYNQMVSFAPRFYACLDIELLQPRDVETRARVSETEGNC
jgi:hypothetical protein